MKLLAATLAALLALGGAALACPGHAGGHVTAAAPAILPDGASGS